jgi:predicted NBD/HSP70 family sugar kinase
MMMQVYSSNTQKKFTTRDIRHSNRLNVLHHLLIQGPSNRQELSRLTGLSPATITNLTTPLIQEELIIEVGLEESQGGRPTTILAINYESAACVGIDCAETYIHFELFDLRLQNLSTLEVPLSSEENQPEQIIDHITDGLEVLLAQAGVEQQKVVGAGISIPGPFEHNTGVSVFAPNWGWHDVPIQALLNKKIPIPLYLDNPLKFSTIAELWFGAGRGVSNFAIVVLGTGIGAGLVINQEIYQGASNSAGEWGHTTLIFNGRPCRCGSKGCMEAYLGAPGIIQTLHDYDPNSPFLAAQNQADVLAQLLAAAQESDPIATKVLDETAQMLGAGLANIINFANPEVIVLSSWVAEQLGAYILPAVEQSITAHALAQPRRAAQIVLSQFTSNPVSLGAAAMVVERYFDEKTEAPSR